MNNGYKDNDFLLARIFTSAMILPVLFALLTAFVSSVASAQDNNEPDPPVTYQDLTQYLKANEEYNPKEDVEHWDNADFWSQGVAPPDTCNSIFVVGDGFHLRAHNGNGNRVQEFGTSDSTKPNYLYVGYGVDLTTGTVNLNQYAFAALHLKGQNWVSDTITIEQLYLGNGEVFQGAAGATMTLDGNITVEGNAAFRNVAEANNGDDQKEDRVLIIKSSIHGSGTIHFEAERTHGLHTTEIYLTSKNNDFTGNVYIESGTNIQSDDPYQEQDSYDYQTHLFLTGENSLYNAARILNEGIVNISANQIFNNYDGVNSVGQFTGAGQMIVNKGVNVKLVYNDAGLIDESLGLVTINSEGNNRGKVEFDIQDGLTKTITMSEVEDDYSKIEGQGKLVKSGNGTLQIVAAAEGLVGAESFVISSGRLDMQGYFTGDVIIGEELPDPDTGYTTGTFSPGDVVGATANIIGDFDVNDGSTLAFEQNASGMDKLVATNFDVSSDSIFDLTMGSEIPGKSYPILVQTSGAFSGTYAESSFWDSLLSSSSQEFWTLFVSGNTVYAKIKGEPVPPVPGVPEPSTWALMILGAAGLLYWRKRK